MFIYTPKTRQNGTLSWQCDNCGKNAWPVRRIMGFPSEKAMEAVEACLAVLLGCERISSDPYLFQCPGCEAGCEVDEGLVAEGHWDPHFFDNELS